MAGCIEALDEAITPFLSTYGPNGTCWSEFEPDQCWQDCRALYEAYANNCPATESCCECLTPQDCAYDPQYEGCEDNQCVGPPTPMFSPCTSDGDCVGLELCFFGYSSTGFCTNSCSNASECGPAPGGSATLACAAIENVGDPYCVLECDFSTQLCPPGMQCAEFSFDLACDYQ